MTEQEIETTATPDDPTDRTGDDPFDVSTKSPLPQSGEPTPKNDEVPVD